MAKSRFRGSFDRAVRSEPLARRGGDELWVFNSRYWGKSVVAGSGQSWKAVEDGLEGQERGGIGQVLTEASSPFETNRHSWAHVGRSPQEEPVGRGH